VLLQLDLAELGRALAHWAQTLSRTLPITDAPSAALLPVAVDGKTLCGSAERPDTPAIRVLSAFVHQLGTTLAQVPIAKTTTEAGTLPDLFSDLVLSGTIITGDAHYSTREVIRTIREKRGTTYYGSKTISHACSVP
jgi:hypothetical protein